MLTYLAYGKTGINLSVNDDWKVQVVEPRFVPGAVDETALLRESLRRPIGSPSLAERVKASHRVGIIFNDITRATPNQLIIPVILSELAHVPRENITLFNALGTHRPNTEEELRRMLGDDLVDRCRIVQNNSFDQSTQVHLGRSSRGHEIWLNSELMACDFRILTGFIEPHFFAGYSGGGKAVMPGMAGLETILGNHSAAHIGDLQARPGALHGEIQFGRKSARWPILPARISW